MIAAVFPDLDGIGFFLGPRTYLKYHHVICHNAVIGLIMALILAAASNRRIMGFLAYIALFHLHLLLDHLGSGTGWDIMYWWPFSMATIPHRYHWEFDSWPNRALFLLFLGWTLFIAYREKRTPLEIIMPSLDRQLVALVKGKPAEPIQNPAAASAARDERKT